MFICVFAEGTLSAQNSLTVANSTATNEYVPVYGYYADAYLRSQTIYPAYMLTDMNGFAITSMSFHFSSAPSGDWGCNFVVILWEVNDTVFDSEAFLSDSGATTVYTGPLNSISGIITLDFDVPYDYLGGNLLVEVTSAETGSYHSAHFLGIESENSSVQGYNYEQTPNNDDATYRDFIPKTTFSYGVPSLCNKPTALHSTNPTTTDITICWSESGNASSYTVQYLLYTLTDWDNYAIEQTVTDTFVTLTNLQPGAMYKFRVNATCSDNSVTDWSMFNFNMLNEPVDLPYYQDFETNPENISDFILTHTGANEWVIGSATGVPDPNSTTTHSLYITSNNGVSNTYDPNTESYAYATMDVAFDNDDMEWHLAFDYRSNGEGTSWDYFSVFMLNGDATVPSSGVPTGTAILSQVTGVTDWTHFDVILNNVGNTSKKIVFFWKNDSSLGNNPPAAVDNISVMGYTCSQPTQFVATSVGSDNVTLNWNETGNSTAWNISYGPQGYTLGGSDEVLVAVTTHPYIVDNLTPATSYDFYVQSDCGSGWAGPLTLTPGSYNMPVSGNETMTTCGLVIFDDGGATGNYSNNCESYLVLNPANVGEKMMVTGLLTTESCCDYLRIYDSVGTSGTLLGEFKGTNQQINVLSTSGPLTLHFHSDQSLVYAGFQLLAECVSCFPPTGLTVENTTLDGATISWNDNADNYVVILSGSTNETFTTSDTTFTFVGLNSSSMYSVQVGTLCGPDTSMLSDPVSFSTSCNPITITADNAWFENFESYSGSGVVPLVCWETPASTTFNNGNFPAAYCGYAPACHSGINSAEFKGNSGEVNIALLPEFTNSIQDLRLSFWATATSTSYGTLEVGVMTDPTDITSFELVGICGQPGSRGSGSATTGNFGNYMGPFDFSGATATSGRIALRFTSNSSSLSWNLDDFTVELIPSCPSPVKTSVTASNIDGHNATITWVDNDPTHSAWKVYYKPTTENDWNYVPANDTTAVLTNLYPETVYDVYVITDCGTPETNPDATLTIHFTTSVACPAPSGLALTSVSTDQATISWNGTANSYNVEYGVTGFTPGTGNVDVTYTNSVNLTNLTPNTTYTLYVNSDCSTANDSLSTTVSFNFTTSSNACMGVR